MQDTVTDLWCSKIARSINEFGKPAFIALREGLKSQIKRVARESLTTIAWLGYEISKSSNSLRYSACEILLGEVEKFLHPGMDLEERFLACLCIYNYASGKGNVNTIPINGTSKNTKTWMNISSKLSLNKQSKQQQQPFLSTLKFVHGVIHMSDFHWETFLPICRDEEIDSFIGGCTRIASEIFKCNLDG